MVTDEKVDFNVEKMSFTMKLTRSNMAVKFKLEDTTVKVTPEDKATKERLDKVKMTLAKSGVGEGSLHMGFKEITTYLATNTNFNLITYAAVKEFAN